MDHQIRNDLEVLARDVFGFDLCDQEVAIQREIVGFILQGPEGARTFVPAFGPCTPELLEAVARKGLVDAKAGWRVDAGSALGLEPVDVFFISDVVLNGPHSEYLATLVHELCHFIVETPITWLEPGEDAMRAALPIRRHTRYAPNGPCDPDQYHTDPWFSVLFEATYRLHLAYPKLYPSQETATEAALCYDLADEKLTGVAWRA